MSERRVQEVDWCAMHEAPRAPGSFHNELYEVCYVHLHNRRFAPKDICEFEPAIVVILKESE